MSVGVAAHITGASPGGPRYDASLSTEERSAAANGIWLCQNCAKLVDNDQSAFSVDLLKTRKRSAEAETLAMVGRTVQSLAPSPQRLTEAEAEILIACAQSGDIARMHVDQLGFWVRAGGRDFVDESDPAIAAEYLDGLDRLLARRLCRHEVGMRYGLTGAGFRVARRLKGFLNGDG